jgi:hypothetical protein
MDDIIVIILTLVVAVVGVLNQNKKKKAAQQAGGGGQAQSPDFLDMLVSEQEIEEEKEQRYLQNELSVEDNEVSMTKTRNTFLSVNEESFVAEKEVKKVVKERKRLRVDGGGFSLKKAIVYNEILNRKYF